MQSLYKYLKIVLIVLALLALLLWGLGHLALKGLKDDQPQMFAEPIFDTVAPVLPLSINQTNASLARLNSVLVFSKTNGYRHREGIETAREMFEIMADKRGWLLFYTENAAVFSEQSLAKFDVVVMSNATGPLMNSQQQSAFKSFLERGGGFVGVHAAGDSSHADWSWYQDQVIRAKFVGHPMLPQFQTATVTTEDLTHPAMAHLAKSWQHKEEWYCFEASPRANVNVLASIDESGLNMLSINSSTGAVTNMAMGDDHPVIWHHDIGRGRVFYSALGHATETYQREEIKVMLESAIIWAGRF